jgi:hypothetical protein
MFPGMQSGKTRGGERAECGSQIWGVVTVGKEMP